MYTRKNGGQIVHYTRGKPWHHRWKPLKSHHMDCGPNCFFVLKYANEETCREMARRTRGGIYPEEILEILNDAYGEGHHWRNISYAGYNDQYIQDEDDDADMFIHTYLNVNEATMASVTFGKNYLHFFVLLKDEFGFHAIDAQTGYTTPLNEYMENYKKKHGYYCPLSIVDSHLHHREPYKVTMRMVKTYFKYEKEITRDRRIEEQKWREETLRLEEEIRRERKTERRALTRKSSMNPI